MNRNYKILILAVIFSFIWGAWWGFYNIEKKWPRRAKGPELRVLAQTGVFPAPFVTQFEDQFHVRWQLTEKESELALLREALSHNSNYDFIVLPSFVARSFLIDNVFHPLSDDGVQELKNISVDFKNLEFDPDNRYLVPLSWGLNGFLVNSKKVSLENETLSELLKNKSQITFLPWPAELFNLMIKVKPIVKNWVETGQSEELQKDVKDLRSSFALLAADGRGQLKDEKVNIVQITNGQAAQLVGEGAPFRFVLPRERATLWLTLMGVSRGAKNRKRVEKVIDQLLSQEMQILLTQNNEQAAVRSALDPDKLPLLQRAEFIRQVPLSRVELFIHHEALEPTWMQALKKEWPNEF